MNSNFWISTIENHQNRRNTAIRRYRYIIDLQGEINNVVIISRDRNYNADQNRVTG